MPQNFVGSSIAANTFFSGPGKRTGKDYTACPPGITLQNTALADPVAV